MEINPRGSHKNGSGLDLATVVMVSIPWCNSVCNLSFTIKCHRVGVCVFLSHNLHLPITKHFLTHVVTQAAPTNLGKVC